MLWCVVIGVWLSGCAVQGQPRESFAAWNHRECLLVLQQYPDWDAGSARQFMRTCDAIRPTGGYASAPTYQAHAQSGYGQPDAFGPMGVWGPTWQGFNSRFQDSPPR